MTHEGGELQVAKNLNNINQMRQRFITASYSPPATRSLLIDSEFTRSQKGRHLVTHRVFTRFPDVSATPLDILLTSQTRDLGTVAFPPVVEDEWRCLGGVRHRRCYAQP